MAKEITLFDDQMEFVDNLRDAIRKGNKSVLGVASTGMGKTIVSAYIARSAWLNGKTVWFVCHLKNLLWQTSKAFWSLGIEHGQIASGKRSSKMPVQIATIGTLGKRMDALEAPDLLIVDEAHLSMARTWKRVIDWARESGSTILGNSATPERLDGKGLDNLFDAMVEARPMTWLIQNGRLSEYVVYSTRMTPDLTDVKSQAGDFSQKQLASAMDKPVLLGDAASHWKRHADGLRTIAYCVSIKHSEHTAAHLNRNGIPAVHVDGETPPEDLREAINGFADGRYKVLCNVQLMTTGFDLSAQVGREVPIEACIMLRPTQSVALYLQMVGRALRKKPFPAVILDHAGNVMRHGLPDEDREWSLEGRPKGKRKAKDEEDEAPGVQQCQHCFHVFAKGPSHCPACGEALPGNGKPELEVVEGELEKVDVEQVRRERKREQGQARTLRDLVELGLRRGMNKPAQWAAITLAARQGKKPSGENFAEAKRVMAEVKSGNSTHEEAF